MDSVSGKHFRAGASTAVLLLVFAVFFAQSAPGAQDVLPTPRGQLGGAPSLDTPVAGPDQPVTEETDLVVPDPSECRVEPRTIEEVQAIAADPGEPDELTASDVLDLLGADPQSVPAAVALQMELTVREAVACSNAGEVLRLWALFTDDYLRRGFARSAEPMDAADLESLATPQAGRGDAMPELVGFWQLGDGRTVAWVRPVDDRPITALTPEPGELVVVFALVEGEYRIDENFSAANGRPERPATPVVPVP